MSALLKDTTIKNAQNLIREFDLSMPSQETSPKDTILTIQDALTKLTNNMNDEKAAELLGDTFFEIFRLANQLHIDLEDAFILSHPRKTTK